MRIALIIVLASLALACSPEAAPPSAMTTAEPPAGPAAASAHAEFMAPSGNIACVYTPAGGTEIYETPDGAAELKCDRAEPDYVRITLSEHGAASVMSEVGDAGCCSGEMLAYGEHWSAGPFQCDLAESGLTCSNAEGRGFTLSRDRAQPN
jgi:hypothetical protein